MSAQPGDQHWFISLNGKRYGPYSFAALSEAAAKGVIDGNTSVWRLGWVKWHPARRVPGLIEETPPPERLDQISDQEGGEGKVADDRASAEIDRAHWPDEDAGTAVPRRQGRLPPEDDQIIVEGQRKLRPHSKNNVVEVPRRWKSQADEDEQVAAEGQRKRGAENDVVEAQRPSKTRAAKDVEVTAEGQRKRHAENDVVEAQRPRKTRAAKDEEVTAEGQRKQRAEDDVVEAPRRRKSNAAEHEDDLAEAPLRVRPPPADDDFAVDAPPIAERLPNGARLRAEEDAVPQVQVEDRLAPAPSSRPARRFAGSGAVSALAVLLFAGAGWGLFASGMIVMVEPRRSSPAVESVPPVAPEPPPPATAAPAPAGGVPSNLAANSSLPDAGGLPNVVAAMPAVIALQRSDPAAFARFSKRFADSAANAPEDALPSLARTALRKAVKRQLASSSADALVEITAVYLGYMQALQTLSPESCVALSDESKGANLTVNLGQQLPVLFAREMAVLERVAALDPAATVAAPTADQARPYLDKVYMQLLKQPVQSELLGRATLAQSEFTPYCALVVAFYQSVLTLPSEDRVKLLRYLYAAAIDPDDEAK